MLYAEEIRRQAREAPRAALPAVTAALWRAYTEGKVSEAEAEALSGLIEARTDASAPRLVTGTGTPATASNRPGNPRKPGVGSRPRTDASMERRRRWAASGCLPPGIASKFTLAEQAVLALVAAETTRRGDCRLAVGHIAAIAGLSETTVRNAIREARRLGLITVEERPVTGFRNLPNVVRIVSAEWTAWLRLARKGSASCAAPSPVQGGGCKSPKGTHTQVLRSGKTKPAMAAQGALARPVPSSR